MFVAYLGRLGFDERLMLGCRDLEAVFGARLIVSLPTRSSIGQPVLIIREAGGRPGVSACNNVELSGLGCRCYIASGADIAAVIAGCQVFVA